VKGLVRDHWFRADALADPCVYPQCGKAFEDHVEACGEWMEPRHFYIPFWGGCADCGRHWRHSTHWVVSPKNRSLWFWPKVQQTVHRFKDRLVRRETCWHLSHRLKLPCWRSLYGHCRGVCEKHYDCEEC
jgi:hypothetical protein